MTNRYNRAARALTRDEAREIYLAGASMAVGSCELAEQYGVSNRTVSHILSREHYREWTEDLGSIEPAASVLRTIWDAEGVPLATVADRLGRSLSGAKGIYLRLGFARHKKGVPAYRYRQGPCLECREVVPAEVVCRETYRCDVCQEMAELEARGDEPPKYGELQWEREQSRLRRRDKPWEWGRSPCSRFRVMAGGGKPIK